jgi:glucose/arabinose dehydrogenase
MSWHRRTRLLTATSILCLSSCGAATASPTATVTATLLPIGAGLLGRSGLSATVYATGLKTASAFALDSNGRLWVATADYTDRSKDGLYVVTGAGAAPREVVSGLHTPLGLLWYGGSLFVSSHARVDAYAGFDGVAFATHHTILTLATNVGENNALVLAPDGRMLIGISAPCDHCTPSNPDSAAIISFLPDGSDVQVYASRIRAPVGLAFDPGTNQLLVTMNQRDDLGTRTPGDWLAVVRPGQSWGFPDCYGQGGSVCSGVPQPLASLDKHAAVSDVAVVTGQLGTIGSAALVAEWADGVVQDVSLTTTASQSAGSVTPYLRGVQRPVALLLSAQSVLFVGDWATGKIYRLVTG